MYPLPFLQNWPPTNNLKKHPIPSTLWFWTLVHPWILKSTRTNKVEWSITKSTEQTSDQIEFFCYIELKRKRRSCLFRQFLKIVKQAFESLVITSCYYNGISRFSKEKVTVSFRSVLTFHAEESLHYTSELPICFCKL